MCVCRLTFDIIVIVCFNHAFCFPDLFIFILHSASGWSIVALGTQAVYSVSPRFAESAKPSKSETKGKKKQDQNQSSLSQPNDLSFIMTDLRLVQ